MTSYMFMEFYLCNFFLDYLICKLYMLCGCSYFGLIAGFQYNVKDISNNPSSREYKNKIVHIICTAFSNMIYD